MTWRDECSVDDCRNIVGPKGARGLCTKHYQRLLSTGSPTGSLTKSPAERFWPKVQFTGSCWLWTASVDQSGYGMFSFHGSSTRAHRFAYAQLVGPIPDGLVLDHLCRNPACVNPDHLEIVTNQENLRRGIGCDVSQGRRNHCRHGHEYTPINTYITSTGAKACRTCRAESRRRYENRKAAA